MASPRQNNVENRGSTARDHLANERTFLAWLRTGLGVVGLGLLLEKMVNSEGSALLDKIMAAALLVAGVLLVVYGLLRYLRVQGALREGRFVIAQLGPLWIGAVAVVLITLLALWQWGTL